MANALTEDGAIIRYDKTSTESIKPITVVLFLLYYAQDVTETFEGYMYTFSLLRDV